MKKPPSTAQKLAVFREDCRQFYNYLRNPDKRKARVEPNVNIFQDDISRSLAITIKFEELKKHEKILSEQPRPAV